MAKILLVDDTRTMVEVLKVFLKGHGYEYVVARDGREAVAVAEREHPDLIISDVMMPVMNGVELAREIKRTPGLSHIPIILISSQWNTERRNEALAAGAVICLEKPLQDAWLVKVVDRLVNPEVNGPLSIR
jgi:CheY-like chemotaxis protein